MEEKLCGKTVWDCRFYVCNFSILCTLTQNMVQKHQVPLIGFMIHHCAEHTVSTMTRANHSKSRFQKSLFNDSTDTLGLKQCLHINKTSLNQSYFYI